jgi:hypothetical protein
MPPICGSEELVAFLKVVAMHWRLHAREGTLVEKKTVAVFG